MTPLSRILSFSVDKHNLDLAGEGILRGGPRSEANLARQLAEAAPGDDGQHVDIGPLPSRVMSVSVDAHRFADEVVEEVGVLLLRGDVTRVEHDGEAERKEVVHITLPRGIVELHLKWVSRVVGDGEDLGDHVVPGRIRPDRGWAAALTRRHLIAVIVSGGGVGSDVAHFCIVRGLLPHRLRDLLDEKYPLGYLCTI